MMQEDIHTSSRISPKLRLFFKLISAAVILVAAAYFYDSLSLNKIAPKADPAYLRIGYTNLHASKVSSADLKKLESYNCDIWLFLEWNGDNFSSYSKFLDSYTKNYEVANQETYGILVLSRKPDVRVEEKALGKLDVCNYPMQLIHYGNEGQLNIYLAHAPPPVPSCDIKTDDYLENLSSMISQTENAGGNIIIGDLNTLPFQASIRKIKDQGYSDARDALKLMPQGTFSFFPGLPKLIKIDYVFHKGEISPKQLARFSLSSSDHSGWAADFQLR